MSISALRRFGALLATLVAVLLPLCARAERADKDKPTKLEADKVTVDDKNKVHVFEGRVTLSQGTLAMTADKLIVRQDAEGFHKGIAHGNPARFRQKREAEDEYVQGEAQRIEHDARTERTEFFGRAYVKSGRDEVRGEYIRYDGLSEQYFVTSGPEGTVAKPVPGGDPRVRAVIQPRSKDSAAPQPSPSSPAAGPASETAIPR